MFLGQGDDHFLSWPPRNEEQGLRGWRINTIALAESVLLFSILARDVFAYATPTPGEMAYILQLRNMAEEGTMPRLTAAPVRRNPAPGGHTKTAPFDSNGWQVAANLEMEPAAIAFQMVARVYEWFGFDHEEIPYAVISNDMRIINREAILSDER